MHASGETRANTQPRMLLSEVLRAGGVVQPLQWASTIKELLESNALVNYATCPGQVLRDD